MNASVLFTTATRAILRNKTRSILTMLGVIIGVMAVILLLAIGSGIQKYISDQFNSLGANTVLITPGQVFNSSGGFSNSRSSSVAQSKINNNDMAGIRKLKEYVVDASAMFQSSADVSYKGHLKKGAGIIGADYSFSDVRNIKAEKGRFFDKIDQSSKRRVAVLGPKIAEDLFGSVDPIGKNVSVADSTFEVIGVTEEKGGGFGGPSFDEYVYIPLTTAHSIFNSEVIMGVAIKIIDQTKIAPAIPKIENVLLEHMKDDEFSVFDQRQLLDTINGILGIITTGLGGIAAISLLVGGIGIMNIMLVSVTERTREIGLRKALGATPNLIMSQFLIESSVLSIMGGGIGIGLSYGITLIMQQFFPATVTLWSVGLAFFVSATVGVVFGVLPARKAASLSPIEALRYE
jgi:putative ABC transport system permease protein